MAQNKTVDFKCNICNKIYNTRAGLWKHNYTKHTKNNSNIPHNILSNSFIGTIVEATPNFKCLKCNKGFTRNDNLKRHDKNCNKVNYDLIIEQKEKEYKLLKLERDTQKLKNEINNVNNGIINNGNITNDTTIVLRQPFDEKRKIKLHPEVIMKIFLKDISSLIELIKEVHFNANHPENHVFKTNSMNGKYTDTINFEKNTIDIQTKKYFYHEVMTILNKV